jgi:hypothetical protein
MVNRIKLNNNASRSDNNKLGATFYGLTEKPRDQNNHVKLRNMSNSHI